MLNTLETEQNYRWIIIKYYLSVSSDTALCNVYIITVVHCLYRSPAKNRLIIDKYKELVLTNYKEPDLNGHFDDCTKDVLKELYVQEEEMSDSDEESAEVDDK